MSVCRSLWDFPPVQEQELTTDHYKMSAVNCVGWGGLPTRVVVVVVVGGMLFFLGVLSHTNLESRPH